MFITERPEDWAAKSSVLIAKKLEVALKIYKLQVSLVVSNKHNSAVRTKMVSKEKG